METEQQAVYNTKYVKRQLGKMALKFFLPAEFPFVDRGDEPALELNNAMHINADMIERYALSLNGRQIENLLLSLRGDLSKSEIDRLGEIFDRRMNKRLFELLWILFQFNVDSQTIFELLSRYNKFINEMIKSIYFEKGNPIENIVKSQDVLVAIVQIIIELGGKLGDAFERLKIIVLSPFGKEVTREFFSVCDKRGLEDNIDSLLKYIIQYEDIPKRVLINYLLKLEVDEYNQQINGYIIAYFSAEYSELWSGIDTICFDKFSLWYKKRFIFEHTEKGSAKQKLLLNYLEYITSVDFDIETGLFSVEFKDFYIINFATRQDVSYFIVKDLFQQLLRDGNLEPQLVGSGKRKFIETKEYILELLDDEIIVLSFFEVDTLYIYSLIDIKLNLDVDISAARRYAKRKANSVEVLTDLGDKFYS